MKRVVLLLFIVMLAFAMLLSSGIALAQEDVGDSSDEISGEEDLAPSTEEEFEEELEDLIEEAENYDEEFDVDAGLTPDSPFYFLDNLFEGSPEEERQEKIAEMKVMARECKQGDEGACDGLEVAFEKYKEHAEEFEREVSPEQEEEAERSSKAIRGVLIRDIAENLPPTLKDDYVKEIVLGERNIDAAGKIASKIKELCDQLAGLDPGKFYDVCRPDEDSGKWHDEYYEDITEEQKKLFKADAKIIEGCIETSGSSCACEDINFVPLADMCEYARPLAVICGDFGEDYIPDDDFEDDFEEEETPAQEKACDDLDDLEFPDMPPYLRELLYDLEDRYEEDNYDDHIPRACREAGIDGRGEDDRDRCMEIMIFSDDDSEIPRECKEIVREAFNNGERSESKFRHLCESVMFDRYGPDECEEKGITDPRECAELFGDRFDRRGPDRGPGFGGDCRSIEDSEGRLACYDGAGRDIRGFEERYRATKEEERQCAETCSAQGKAWDFSNGCTCFGGDYEGYEDYYDRDYHDSYRDDYEDYRDDYGKYDDYEPDFDCSVMFCGQGSYCDPYRGCVSDDKYGGGGPGFDCTLVDCFEGQTCSPERGCYYPDEPYDDYPYRDDFDPGCAPGDYYSFEKGCYSDNSGEFNVPDNPDYDSTYGGDGASCNEGYQREPSGDCVLFYDSSPSPEVYEESPSEPVPELAPEPEPEPEPSGDTTGSVIYGITGNAFLDYYYN